MKRTLLLSSIALSISLLLLLASDPGVGDWPMWGGTPDRNMVSPMKGIPTTWDVATKKNVKWMGQLGSQSYGNPVVAGGQVYAGTNNELLRNPKEGGDRGVLMCFRESDGKFLWQHTNEKLPAGRANDWPYQGVCSSPMVEGDLLYYVNNRCELVCLDTHGDRKGGAKVVWEDNSVGEKILHGQWASPTVAKIGGVVQVIHPQGDGWLRSYEALTGKKLWEFDTNPKDSVWPKTRNETISTPVVFGDVVYQANGQDPEHGEGVGHLYAIDGTKRGDITKTGQLWHYDKIRRSISTGAVYNGLLFYADFSGFLHCLDAKTGKPYWTHDMLAAIWGSPMVIDGKVYLGDEDGDVVVMQAAKEKKLIAEMNMGSSVYSTPVPANGALFIVNRNQIFALANK